MGAGVGKLLFTYSITCVIHSWNLFLLIGFNFTRDLLRLHAWSFLIGCQTLPILHGWMLGFPSFKSIFEFDLGSQMPGEFLEACLAAVQLGPELSSLLQGPTLL